MLFTLFFSNFSSNKQHHMNRCALQIEIWCSNWLVSSVVQIHVYIRMYEKSVINMFSLCNIAERRKTISYVWLSSGNGNIEKTETITPATSMHSTHSSHNIQHTAHILFVYTSQTIFCTILCDSSNNCV